MSSSSRLEHPDILMKDIISLSKNVSDIFLVDSSDMSNIDVAITGSAGTPYEGGMFNVNIKVPRQYPFKHPKFFFKDPIFHPNVDPDDGRVCVDLLKEKWSPSLTLLNACGIIRDLLAEPNPESPLNIEAATMMRDSKEMYDRTVLTWTKHFANGVHEYSPFEEMILKVSELNGSKEMAVKLLTESKWVINDAANKVL